MKNANGYEMGDDWEGPPVGPLANTGDWMTGREGDLLSLLREAVQALAPFATQTFINAGRNKAEAMMARAVLRKAAPCRSCGGVLCATCHACRGDGWTRESLEAAITGM